MSHDVAPDGSPVAVYRALPVEPEFTPVLDLLRPPMSVLDLGCGVGRLANELVVRGFDVTGVDESAEMLRHVAAGVRTVEAGLVGLDLGRTFDAVILASHLVNVADPATRTAFLQATADHVAPAGVVLIEHWEVPPPEPADSDGAVGDVAVEFRVLGRRGDDLLGRVTYTLGESAWVQEFRATLLGESDLDDELARVGLRRSQRLSPKWVAAHKGSG
jgi:SAM-dependent methyltransferase